MTLIKIISGVYGYRPEKSPYVIPVSSSDPAISVDDDEAARLVEIGVAAYVDAGAVATAIPGDPDSKPISNKPGDKGGENGDSTPGEIDGSFDPEALKAMKMDDLKKLAEGLCIDTTGIKKKGDLIAAINAAEASSDGPELRVEDVVE